jgi:hypothetical protein
MEQEAGHWIRFYNYGVCDGFCGHGNEPSGSIKGARGGIYLAVAYDLMKKDSAPWR